MHSRRSDAAPPATGPASGPVLGIDTTGDEGSVAVWIAPDGGGTVAARTFRPGRSHSAALLPAIGEVLREAGLVPRDLALVAATRGPGSFTGLRIGLASALGLSLSSGVPAAGVSSLAAAAAADALAVGFAPREGGEDRRRRFSVVDALRGEVFCALFEGRSFRSPAGGPWRLRPEAAARMAVEQGADVICGPGAPAHRKALAGPTPLASGSEPLAPAVARLGWAAHRDGSASLEPIYLRNPDAAPYRPGRGC